jgi:hypothetical protein
MGEYNGWRRHKVNIFKAENGGFLTSWDTQRCDILGPPWTPGYQA